MQIHHKKQDFHSRLIRLLVRISLFLIVAVVVVILYRKLGFGIPCLIYKLTGFYCPGCGTMRAFNAIAEFDFYSALRYNMLLAILLPAFILFFIVHCIDELRGKKKNRRWETRLCIILIMISVIYGLLRNLPYFEFLQPIN